MYGGVRRNVFAGPSAGAGWGQLGSRWSGSALRAAGLGKTPSRGSSWVFAVLGELDVGARARGKKRSALLPCHGLRLLPGQGGTAASP
jgi:hypothetical protein